MLAYSRSQNESLVPVLCAVCAGLDWPRSDDGLIITEFVQETHLSECFLTFFSLPFLLSPQNIHLLEIFSTSH